MSKFYVGDVGTLVRVDVGQDVSSATTLELHVRKPSGITAVWAASLYGTQELRYTTLDGDLNEPGEYTLQAFVEMASWKGRGDAATFSIERPFT